MCLYAVFMCGVHVWYSCEGIKQVSCNLPNAFSTLTTPNTPASRTKPYQSYRPENTTEPFISLPIGTPVTVTDFLGLFGLLELLGSCEVLGSSRCIL